MPFSGTGTGIQNANDVFFSALNQGQTLQYNGTTAKWNNVIATSDPALGGDLTGTASNAQIASGAVGSSELADSSITEAKLAAQNAPGTNQYLQWNGSAMVWAAPPGGGGSGGSESFSLAGTLQTGVGVNLLYNDSGSSRTIVSVRASVGTAPTGSSVVIDVNVNGTTVFPTQSERPTIAVSTLTSGAVSRSASWPSGQALSIDIDQIGSTVAGANLVVTIEYQ